MKTKLFACLLFISTLLAGPSAIYLDEHGAEKILDSYKYYSINAEDWDFFQSIIAEENDQFFGYHGSTMNYRLFQDAVRVAVEKTEGKPLPEDFYYLRAPGSTAFENPSTVEGFFEVYDRKVSPEIRDHFVTMYLIPELAKKGIQLSHLPKEAHIALDRCLHRFAEMHDFYVDLVLFRNDMAKEPLVAAGFAKADLPAYFVAETEEEFNAWLHEEIDALINVEGFATASFPEAHDLAIALVSSVPAKPLLEIMSHKQMWDNWYVSIVWGTFSDEELTLAVHAFLYPINDTKYGQRERLLCLNVPLFGNHFRSDESTISIFLGNSSIEGGDYQIVSQLANFYESIGLSRTLADSVFKAGKKALASYKNTRGVIFQFFDTSEIPFDFLNKIAYASRDYGYPYRNIVPKDLFNTSRYPRDRSIDIQLRMVTGNSTTLNPDSPIRMKRYDSLPPEAGEKILNAMRSCLNGTKQPSKTP